MKIPSIKNYFIAAASGAFAIFIREVANASANNVIGYVYAVIAGVICFLLLNILLHVPSAFKLWRAFTKEEEKFSGDWIETVLKNGKKYYTVFSILYIWSTDKYVVSGVSLDFEGNLHASWDSQYIKFDHDIYKLEFLFSAQQKETNSMTGYAEVTFFRTQDKKPIDGKGFFIDMATNPIRVEYSLERIDSELMIEILGVNQKYLKGKQREKFIKAYHKSRYKL